MAVEDDDGEAPVDIEETAPTVDGIEEVEAAPSEPVNEPPSEPVSDAVVNPSAEPVVELFAEPSSEPSVETSNEAFVEPLEATKPVPHSRVRLIAFASGRGGTGRSLLAANVAVYLAQAAKKVVAIDADPAGGPCTSCSARRARRAGSASSCAARPLGLNELIVDTPIAGVGLIGGEGSTFGASRPKQTAKGTLAAIAALEVDYVIVDLGPADSTLTIDLWLGADVPVLVTLPDPASIESIYRFAKSALRPAPAQRCAASTAW